MDRDRDTMAVEGWSVESYLKNPVVLWCHDQSIPPIGRALSVVKRSGQIRASIEFAPREAHPLAGCIEDLSRAGFIRACSVGFLPTKYAFNEKRGGFDFLEQELLEFSLVGVPSNPEALVVGKGFDVGPLRAWAEGALGAIEPGLWVPKAAALRALEPIQEISGDVLLGLLAPRLAKRGRVLSAANETRIREARGGADAVCQALDAVLEQMVVPEPDEDDAKAAPVLRVLSDPTFRVTTAEVEAAVTAAVTRTVRAGVLHALGRLED